MRVVGLSLCLSLVGGVAAAAQATPPTTVTATPTPPAPPPPPPYSLPWQLRPLPIATVLRSDTSVAFYEGKNAMTGDTAGGATVASMLLGTYKVTPNFAPLVRVAFVQNTAPDLTTAPGSGVAFVNTILGGTYRSEGRR